MLFSVTPDKGDLKYKETYKVCSNACHFLNKYLCVKKVSTEGAKGHPTMSTCRAFQRMATIFMCGFLFSRFKDTTPSDKISKLKMYTYVCVLFEEMAKNGNPFHGLGYDIGLRNWIGETNKDKFELYEPKPRIRTGKLKAVQLQEVPQEIVEEELKTTFENWDTKFSALSRQNTLLTERVNAMYPRLNKMEYIFKSLAEVVPLPTGTAEVDAPVARIPVSAHLLKQDTSYSSEDNEEAEKEKTLKTPKRTQIIKLKRMSRRVPNQNRPAVVPATNQVIKKRKMKM
jgi:hypothetical protein